MALEQSVSGRARRVAVDVDRRVAAQDVGTADVEESGCGIAQAIEYSQPAIKWLARRWPRPSVAHEPLPGSNLRTGVATGTTGGAGRNHPGARAEDPHRMGCRHRCRAASGSNQNGLRVARSMAMLPSSPWPRGASQTSAAHSQPVVLPPVTRVAVVQSGRATAHTAAVALA